MARGEGVRRSARKTDDKFATDRGWAAADATRTCAPRTMIDVLGRTVTFDADGRKPRWSARAERAVTVRVLFATTKK